MELRGGERGRENDRISKILKSFTSVCTKVAKLWGWEGEGIREYNRED
jgi:hypothetical protein